ncbi:amidohydrolase family protein (plasmid) [Isosphaeraceae bacterium EP7]
MSPTASATGSPSADFRGCGSARSTWLDSKAHYPLWREDERLGAVFILPHQMTILADMAARFLGVKIVVDHLGKPDLRRADPWSEFRKLFALKKFPQVWISASEPYELSLTGQLTYRDTVPYFKAVYEEFGGRQLIWGTHRAVMPRKELGLDSPWLFIPRNV